MENLYVHFPFCRSKCRYCALYSRVGVSPADRAAYVRRLADQLSSCAFRFSTVYFGGGSPALCDLSPLREALRACCGAGAEFTVELHPLDVTEAKLDELAALGVNRISMGVQSFDDRTLAAMGRGYTAGEAVRAFADIRRRFDNAGIDLIVGYPGDEDDAWREGLDRLCEMGLKHCSVYSLQNERGLAGVPDDNWVLDRIRALAAQVRTRGLKRYEISNYAQPGFECRHNLAVWRGEDYFGLGDGACGRIGRLRTRNAWRFDRPEGENVTAEFDRRERALFRLRTREGLDTSSFPEWRRALDSFVGEGLLTKADATYFLTERGTEVCDSILASL